MPYGTREEKTRLARNSGLWWLGALLLLLLSPLPGRLLPEDVQRTIEPKYLLILPVSALVCWVVGCSFHARSKGYPEIMGLCGETKIANKRSSWVSMIQVFEYFISHHLSKSFESVFGGVTCLPGCFS
ncbi:hypothetical protein EON81_27685, partial [bacterium]